MTPIPYRPPRQKKDNDYIRENAGIFIDLFVKGLSWKAISEMVERDTGVPIHPQAFSQLLSPMVPGKFRRLKPYQRLIHLLDTHKL